MNCVERQLHLIEERAVLEKDLTIERFTQSIEIADGAPRLDFVREDARFKFGNTLFRALLIAAHRRLNYGIYEQDAWVVSVRLGANYSYVSPAIPQRPFSRTTGALDAFAAVTERLHINDEAAPGTTVAVRGWLIDAERGAVESAWLEVGDALIPIGLNRDRVDVARAYGAKDHGGRRTGFDATVMLPNDVAPGMHDVRVIGKSKSGHGLYAAVDRRVRIAFPRRPARQMNAFAEKRPAFVRLNDTIGAAYTHGRGAHTVRGESSLHVYGFFEDVLTLHVTAESAGNGPVSAWEFPCDSLGHFDATLWTSGIELGLYELTFANVEPDGRATPLARCWIEIAGQHYIPPLHLQPLRTAPLAEITHFSDGGQRYSDDSPGELVAGRPIAVAGWCLDPVTATAPLADYVEIDGERPIPLSHGLLEPRQASNHTNALCGFGGIIDTTRLIAGEHHLRILASLASSGVGWHIVDDRRVQLADHPDFAIARLRPGQTGAGT